MLIVQGAIFARRDTAYYVGGQLTARFLNAIWRVEDGLEFGGELIHHAHERSQHGWLNLIEESP